MQAKELSSVIAKGDLQACVEVFRGANESQRKSFSKQVIEEFEKIVPERTQPLVPSPQISCASLSLIATCTFPQIKRELDAYLPKTRLKLALDDQLMMAILRDRQPDWLNKLVHYLLEQLPGRFWPLVRSFEVEGKIKRQDSEQYYVGMVQLVLTRSPDYVLDLMRLDHDLLENRLFDLLGCQHSSVLDRFHADVWFPVLLQLVNEEVLDRVKVMAACIKLWLSMKEIGKFATSSAFMAWHSNLHEIFKPTEKEEIALLSVYLLMLSNPRADVIKLAQSKLKENTRHLSVPEFTNHLTSTFSAKGREIPLQSIKLMREFIKDHPETCKESAKCLLQALYHDDSEVRSKALDLFEELTKVDQSIRSEVSTILRAKLGDLGSLRSRVETWLHANEPQQKAKTGAKTTAKTSVAEHEDIEGLTRSRLSEIDKNFQGICHFSELINIAEGRSEQTLAPGLDLRDQMIPRLYSENSAQPIDNVDNLIYALLQVLHGKTNGDDLECALDGMARLCAERPPDFAQRTEALKSHAQKQLSYREGDRPWDRTPFIGNDYKSDIAALILSWLDFEQFQRCFASLLTPSVDGPGLSPEFLEDAVSTPEAFNKTWRGPYTSRISLLLHSTAKVINQLVDRGSDAYAFHRSLKTYTDLMSEVRNSPAWFFSCRVFELTQRMIADRAAPLLSAPTHKNGWIDPVVIPKRLALIENAGIQIGVFDFIQALLRLAPDHRSEALAACKKLKGEYGDVLRFALGGQPPAEMKGRSFWIAAARCRCPFEDDPYTLERFGDLGPDASKVAIFDEIVDGLENLTDDSPRWGDNGLFERHGKFLRATRLLVESLKSAEYPTRNPHLKSISDRMQPVWRTFLPQNRESYFAHEARWISGSLYSPGYPIGDWEPIFDPDTHVNGMAAWMIALGLSARNQDTARTATDALIATIDDTRLDAYRFAEVLGKLMRTQLITLSRWQTAFTQAAKVTPLHAQFMQVVLEQSLKQLPVGDAKPPLKMLDLLFELCCTTGERIHDQASRRYLENISGSGKGAKLAKSLLKCGEDPSHSHRKAAAHQALESRLTRAERWQNSMNAEAVLTLSPKSYGRR